MTVLLIAIFLLLSFVHVRWALFGLLPLPVVPTKDGAPLFIPSPASTLCVAFLLLVAAFIVWLPWRPGLYLLTVVFTLRALGDLNYVGFLKKVRDTDFAWWDTRLYSPLCLLIAWLCVHQL